MSQPDSIPAAVLAEARQERWWRYRCGEPNLDHRRCYYRVVPEHIPEIKALIESRRAGRSL